MVAHILPPDCGQRLLPALVDQLSYSDPNRVFLSFSPGSHPKDGYRDVTYQEFANAINHCSWWLDQNLGCSKEFRTLTYFGSQDLRATVLMYAAVKTGHKLFLSTLGYDSVETELSLLEDVHCDVMLLTNESKQLYAEAISSKRTMQALIVPTVEDLLKKDQGPVYPYSKTYSQAKEEPFVVLHTSGSTGRPKAVSLTHGTLAHHDLFLNAPSSGGKALNLARLSGKRVLLGLLYFHSAAVCFMAFSVYSNITTVLLSPPASAEMVNEAHLLAKVDASLLSPSAIADIVQTPEYLNNLKYLQYLTFAGSPLSREVGNKVKDMTHLFVSFGITECGYYALEETDPENWQYVSFSTLMNYELRHFSEGLYEFFFIRSNDPQKSQGVFSTYPALKEYSAKDLFSKHPTKKELWLYEGRKDDTIIFTNSERYHPQQTERNLNAHPAVKSALVCGHGRSKIALLIEPKAHPKTEDERSALLRDIWPTIELANHKTSPIIELTTHFVKDLVLFTSETRPMVRGIKGTILRIQTAKLYSRDLDRAYIKHAEATRV